MDEHRSRLVDRRRPYGRPASEASHDEGAAEAQSFAEATRQELTVWPRLRTGGFIKDPGRQFRCRQRKHMGAAVDAWAAREYYGRWR